MNLKNQYNKRKHRATTFAIAMSNNLMGSNREKSNIATAILENLQYFGGTNNIFVYCKCMNKNNNMQL